MYIFAAKYAWCNTQNRIHLLYGNFIK